MKKIIIILIFVVATNVGAMFAKGTKIGDLYYNLDAKTKTAEVTYKGNSSYNSYPSLKDVIIPASITYKNVTYSVTGIGESAFSGCKIAKVSIPESITNIGRSAFCYCHDLTGVYISDITAWCKINFVEPDKQAYFSLPMSANPLCYAHSLYLNNILVTELTIPDDITSIGRESFSGCTSLKSVIVPKDVTSIGDCAFANCRGLTSITIPSSVVSFGENTFYGCEQATVYTASRDLGIPNVSPTRIIVLSQEELLLRCYPFAVFAKDYVEKAINEWQQRGEFERTTDWQRRVNAQSRQQKINEFLHEAEQQYIAYRLKAKQIDLKLEKYDADNEVFAMTTNQFGNVYMAVPYDEAQYFKSNWHAKDISYQLQIKDDQFKIAFVSIKMPNGKEYSYRNTDAVNYNLSEAEYNFDPIELNLSSVSDGVGGQQNITTTRVKIGKSKVDTSIPQSSTLTLRTFVLIFANEDYKNVASVPFAKNDGLIFQKYCQKTLGIPISNIRYVENASYNDMRIQLAWLNDVCNAFDGYVSLIVYYAGHGIPEEESKSAYLLPVDGDGRYVQSAYKLDDFYQKLGAMNAKKVTVFMDACFSGSKREEGMLASARGVALKTKSGVPQGNMVVFSAAQGDETAYPNNDESHGMFTYYLLKKLQETQGDVTLQELGEYITTNVRQQSIVKNGKSQTPCVTPSATIGTDWQTWKLK